MFALASNRELPFLRTQLNHTALIKDVIIRASAAGSNVDVIISADGPLTVKDSGSTVVHQPTETAWSQSYGNPAILTVHRDENCFQKWKASKQYWYTVCNYKWKVTFASGGQVVALPTTQVSKEVGGRNRDCGRDCWRRGDQQIWLWFTIPSGLLSGATGLCRPGGGNQGDRCSVTPELPYIWCEGDPSCLPQRVADSLFTTSEIASLESEWGFASGSSQRPDICTPRPKGELDCGFYTNNGSPGENRPIVAKWPRNFGIYNGLHSGTQKDGQLPRYTHMAEYMYGHADGVCDTGACEIDRGLYWSYNDFSFPDGHICLAPYRELCNGGGTCGSGGAIEDPDCPYDYEFRDSTRLSGQACWDWCTNYVHEGRNL